MAGARDKRELAKVVHGGVKNLLQFTHILFQFDPADQRDQVFFLDRAGFELDKPLALRKADGLSEVAVSLGYGPDRSGGMAFYSDKPDGFEPLELNIIQLIASLVSPVAGRMSALEQIHVRELQKEMLITLSCEMAKIRDKNELLTLIKTKLKRLFYFTYSCITTIGEDMETFFVYLTDPESGLKRHPDHYSLITKGNVLEDGICDVTLQSELPTVFDLEAMVQMRKASLYHKAHYESGSKEMISVPLRGPMNFFGILSFFSDRKNSFSPDDFTLIKGVASQVFIAISNIIAQENSKKREKEREILLSVSNDISIIRDTDELLKVLRSRLKEFIVFDELFIQLFNENRSNHRGFLTTIHPDWPGLSTLREFDWSGQTACDLSTNDISLKGTNRVRLACGMEKGWKELHPLYAAGIREMISVSLGDRSKPTGILTLISENDNSFNESQLNVMIGIADQLSIAISNILANEKIENQLKEIRHYKQKLELENLYLQQEICTVFNYSELIGSGTAMQKVYQLLSQVSRTNSTVLILGETGTGKELIARALHNSSLQKDKLMVKVNCAALPAGLIESELFGHERGSFTGAFQRKIGKFELANNSTLFLDEIGEMPLELQVKLLRVLQEKEIERVGGEGPIKVKVRIIAATNRDLRKEVELGRFRADLYYRLNVFPIVLPPLRERMEDLPALTSHFVTRLARSIGKKVMGVSQKVMNEMMAYRWPGNIRELEHVIERCVLLTDSEVIRNIHLPVGDLPQPDTLVKEHFTTPINEMEKAYIIEILRKCKGKVQGAGGAAELLKIPPTTLHSKMKKLGIIKKQIFESM